MAPAASTTSQGGRRRTAVKAQTDTKESMQAAVGIRSFSLVMTSFPFARDQSRDSSPTASTTTLLRNNLRSMRWNCLCATRSARTHSPSQVTQIAASIAEFGFVNPVLVDAEGVLIAGHGRVMAAKQLGLASVPVLRLGHISPAQARALRLADNQIALNSGWDEALLALEIARIRDEAVVDLDVLGFSGMELDRLLAAADAGLGDDADEAPAVPVVPVTRTGDLWRCGDHRLLCGDATRIEDVQRALPHSPDRQRRRGFRQ